MSLTANVTNNKKIIIDIFYQHVVNNILDINYMVSIFNAYSHIINLYPEVVQVLLKIYKICQ